jgi:hypothetical protein
MRILLLLLASVSMASAQIVQMPIPRESIALPQLSNAQVLHLVLSVINNPDKLHTVLAQLSNTQVTSIVNGLVTSGDWGHLRVVLQAVSDARRQELNLPTDTNLNRWLAVLEWLGEPSGKALNWVDSAKIRIIQLIPKEGFTPALLQEVEAVIEKSKK